MDGFTVQTPQGERVVVSAPDAAKLAGVAPTTIEHWIRTGKIDITYDPSHKKMVFVDSLWLALPEELRVAE